MSRNGVSTTSSIRLGQVEPFDLGPLRVEPAHRQLGFGERWETLEPRIMQVFVALARAQGRVVSRDELIETCWGGVTVGENAIDRTISRLRKIGRDLGPGAFRIETVARVGHRLRTAPQGPAAATATGPPGPTLDKATCLCVLPLRNASGDNSQDYLTDGLTEDIITELSRISAISVTSGRTSFALKGSASDMKAIGESLGVSHALEGSVRRIEGRFRVSLQLIEIAADRVIWAERYDLAPDQILSLQDDISRAVASALGRALTLKDRQRLVQRRLRNPEAFETLLMARQYYRTGHAGSLARYRTVIDICGRATALDPDYADAWALMAAAQANLRRHFAQGDGGRAAVARALDLDGDLPTARAIHGQIAMMAGDYDLALSEVRKALALDEECLEANLVAGQIHYRLRQLDAAIRYWERAAVLAETDFIPTGLLATCYATHGDLERARQAARSLKLRTELALFHEGDNSSAIGFAAYAHAVLGEVGDADRLITEARARGETNLQMKTSFVRALVLLGRHGEALDLLEEVLAAASAGFAIFAATDPSYDPLRDHPRFVAMMAR